MTTLDIIQSYQDLLIQQYNGLPRASAHIQTLVTPIVMPQVSVQTVTFALAPTSGQFVLSWGVNSTAAIAWNDSAATVQTKLAAVSGLASVTVTGSIASLTLTVTFTGVTPAAALLVLVSNSLLATATAVTPVITETDLTLPLAVQNAFNLIAGTSTAVGDQLDTIGKYAGVARSGYGFSSYITLSDTDYLSLIRMAIAQNAASSSLADIVAFFAEWFPNEVLVVDTSLMRLSYLISTAVGSQDLIQLMITEGVIPKPMAVNILPIIYAPVINSFFGFRTYAAPVTNAVGFNSYSSFNTGWYFLTYADGVTP